MDPVSVPAKFEVRSFTRSQCSRIRILRIFQISKKNMTFYVFLKWRIKKS